MAQTLSCVLLCVKVLTQRISLPPSFPSFLPPFFPLAQQMSLSTYYVPGIENANDTILFLKLHLVTETDVYPDNQHDFKVCDKSREEEDPRREG